MFITIVDTKIVDLYDKILWNELLTPATTMGTHSGLLITKMPLKEYLPNIHWIDINRIDKSAISQKIITFRKH